MDTTDSRMHLAIAFDENYLTPVYTLFASIFANNRQHPISIHAITSGVTDVQKNELREYALKSGVAVYYYAIEDDFGADFILPATLWWTASIYYRLLFPQLLPTEVEKFLYLDTDIIVLGDLYKFYQLDMNGLPLAAVRDFVESRPELDVYGLGNYFNSGVLLIDKVEWIRSNITAKTIDFIRGNADKLRYPDQDALNVVLKDRWVKLSSQFNMMFKEIPVDRTRKDLLVFLQDVIVLHYTTQHKPWAMIGRNKLRTVYFSYLKKVPKKYRRKYADFVWNRHKVREMVEIRLSELAVEYQALVRRWRKK